MDATRKQRVQRALRDAGVESVVNAVHTVSDDGHQAVLKIALCSQPDLYAKVVSHESLDRLECEFVGLAALQNAGVLAVPAAMPVYLGDHQAILFMEALEVVKGDVVDNSVWERLGHELAAHHEVVQGSRYGWGSSNYIGSTQQHNDWCTDWIAFNRLYRLGYQLELAQKRGLLGSHDAKLVEQVVDRLEELIPNEPTPSLIHGDLWAGNAIPARIDGKIQIAVIDPAVSIGDGWADIAMMKLFGGFPEIVFDAYRSVRHDCENREGRILVYQLYHWLNHLNIFGRGYLNAVLSCARACLRN